MSLVLDGVTYDIGIISLARKADILDKMAERTNDGVLHREIIGVYYNYQLKLGSSKYCSNYAVLWQKLSEPVEFHTVTVPDEDGMYTFIAYFAGIGDTLEKQNDGSHHWKGLTVNFIAQSPART